MSEQELVLTWPTRAAVCENFDTLYPLLHTKLYSDGNLQETREGASSTNKSREVLDFKTEILKPTQRCIGGHDRNMNIFFLLAEALWIFAGRRDVAFMDTFNSKLKDYSDDGSVYNAPYGWRIRRHGINSNLSNVREGKDQLLEALNMLEQDNNTRRVVVQIWNAEFDLNKETKDIPCNDLLMFKLREGKLNLTIANRSNDLNWGLTTNVFQFSFLLEIMSQILGVEVGKQVHNSQSLHIYLTEQTINLNLKFLSSQSLGYLYKKCRNIPFKFNFTSNTAEERLNKVDFFIDSMITMLTKKMNGSSLDLEEVQFINDELRSFSQNLYFIYKMLEVYVDYKFAFKDTENKELVRKFAVERLLEIAHAANYLNSDFMALGVNFFIRNIKDEDFTRMVRADMDNYSIGTY